MAPIFQSLRMGQGCYSPGTGAACWHCRGRCLEVPMKRCNRVVSFSACAGCLGIALTVGAYGQPAGEAERQPARQQRPQSSSTDSRAPSNEPPAVPDGRVPLPQGGPVPIGAERLPDPAPPPKVAPNPGGAGTPGAVERPRSPAADPNPAPDTTDRGPADGGDRS